GNLAQYRQRALADFAFAGNDGRAAVVVDAHDGGTAVPVAETAAAVDVHATADAEAAVGRAVFTFLFPADHLRGLVDALLEFAARDLVVVRRHVARIDRVQTQEIDD